MARNKPWSVWPQQLARFFLGERFRRTNFRGGHLTPWWPIHTGDELAIRLLNLRRIPIGTISNSSAVWTPLDAFAFSTWGLACSGSTWSTSCGRRTCRRSPSPSRTRACRTPCTCCPQLPENSPHKHVNQSHGINVWAKPKCIQAKVCLSCKRRDWAWVCIVTGMGKIIAFCWEKRRHCPVSDVAEGKDQFLLKFPQAMENNDDLSIFKTGGVAGNTQFYKQLLWVRLNAPKSYVCEKFQFNLGKHSGTTPEKEIHQNTNEKYHRNTNKNG